MHPKTDTELARAAQLRFWVGAKNARSQSWKRVAEAVDLDDAFSCARDVTTAEVAIFVVGPQGDLRYWSSRKPDTYDSELLRGLTVR